MANNVYDVPDKIVGSAWTHLDHNLMKEVLNGKFDSNDVVTDPNASVSNSTVYSSSAIAAIFGTTGSVFRYRGEIAGATDIGELEDPGYYILPEGEYPSHSSYPLSMMEDPDTYINGGALIVYADGNLVKYTLILNYRSADSLERMLVTYKEPGGTLTPSTKWSEFATRDWVSSQIPESLPDGTPEFVTGYFGLSFGSGSSDTKGNVTFSNTTGSTISAGEEISILFQHPRTDAILVNVTSGVGTWRKLALQNIDQDGFTVMVHEDILDTEGGNFFYQVV